MYTGKGTQVWKKTGAIYDGDWKEGLRHGFGMYSVKKGDEHVKEYAGGWKNDMKHVCMWATPTHWFLVLRFLILQSIASLPAWSDYMALKMAPEILFTCQASVLLVH